MILRIDNRIVTFLYLIIDINFINNIIIRRDLLYKKIRILISIIEKSKCLLYSKSYIEKIHRKINYEYINIFVNYNKIYIYFGNKKLFFFIFLFFQKVAFEKLIEKLTLWIMNLTYTY